MAVRPCCCSEILCTGYGYEARLARTVVVIGLALLAIALVNKYALKGNFDLSLIKTWFNQLDTRLYMIVGVGLFLGYQLSQARIENKLMPIFGQIDEASQAPVDPAPPATEGKAPHADGLTSLSSTAS